MKIPQTRVIVQGVERPNAAKNLFKILVIEPGYVDRFDSNKNTKDKNFTLLWFHEHCDLKKGDKIEATIFVNSNEWIADNGKTEYSPYLVLNQFKPF
ncbi:MAG TPA: hypothetical protein VMW01_16490 [Williamwhitmania sp.]|nr:hypothetical protein [Williamwhitmania sp.]